MPKLNKLKDSNELAESEFYQFLQTDTPSKKQGISGIEVISSVRSPLIPSLLDGMAGWGKWWNSNSNKSFNYVLHFRRT